MAYSRTNNLLKVKLCVLAAFLLVSLAVFASAPAYAAGQADLQQSANSTTALQTKAPTTYKVVFKANGGKGTMKAQTIKRGKKVTLKANAFKRSGYKFVGWNTKKNGKGKTYKNKVKVKNLAKAGKTIKLYGQWKKVSYKILTPYYSFTVPKAWRGKVQWVTKATKVDQYNLDSSGWSTTKTGKKFKTYHTYFYLKGHKNDNRYLLATVGGERLDCMPRTTGFGSEHGPIISKKKGNRFVYVFATNMPFIIGHFYNNSDSYWHIPNTVDDEKAMLKLVVGNTVSYEDAKRYGDVNNCYWDEVRSYLKPKFKKIVIKK